MDITFVIENSFAKIVAQDIKKTLRMEDLPILDLSKEVKEESFKKAIIIAINLSELRRSNYYLSTSNATRFYLVPRDLGSYMYHYFMSFNNSYSQIIFNIKRFINNTLPTFKPLYPANLTQREMQVLECVHKGYGAKEIKDLLNISIKTVDSHIQNIYKKTKVNSLTSLSVYARNLLT